MIKACPGRLREIVSSGPTAELNLRRKSILCLRVSRKYGKSIERKTKSNGI